MLDLHSFGQLILFPWSARSQPTPDAKLHKTNAEGMIKVILLWYISIYIKNIVNVCIYNYIYEKDSA